MEELSLVHGQLMCGVFSGLRVVSDHDDGLSVLAIKDLDETENLFCRVPGEIAGRFLADQNRGIGDQHTCDRDSLLLPTRELSGLVFVAI